VGLDILLANGLALSICPCWPSSSKFSVVSFRIIDGDVDCTGEDNGPETAFDGEDSDREEIARRLMRNCALGPWLAELRIDVPGCVVAASLVKVLDCSPVVFDDRVAKLNAVPVFELLLEES
jgi:hypothetical protein